MLEFPWKRSLFLNVMTNKIIISGGLLLVGLTLAAGIAVYQVMRPQIETTLKRGLEVALQGKVRLFESQIEEGLASTHAVVTRPLLIQALQQHDTQQDNTNVSRDMKRNIDALLQAGFTAAAIYDKHGNEIIQAGHFSQNRVETLPLRALNNTFLVWDDNQLILHDSKAVLNQNNQPIGSVTTERRLRQLTRSLREVRSIGKSGEFLLCELLEEGGEEMVCFISKADGVDFKQLPRRINGIALPISYALDGKSGIITAKDYRQILVVASYTSLSTFGIGMVLKLDEKELYGPIIEQIKTIALYLTALVIAGILLLNWLVMPLVHKLVKSEWAAQERLKESYCLHAIRRDMELSLHADEFYPKVIAHLVEAMQFPEITSVMIKLKDKQFASDRYNQDLMHRLQAPIVVNGEATGWLYVVYSEDQSFFLPEEQDLIDTIASDLGRWIELEQADQRIMQMATHDGLTGLPNRYLLEDRIKQALAHDQRRQEQAAVLFVDLDHFKTINDSLGHAMGDSLLQEVAARLSAIIRSEDTVVRHGGDEFIILLPNIIDNQEAKVVAQKILHELNRSFLIQEKELHIGGSIGIALFPSDGDDMETLLKNSDIAMYHAKKNGRNNYQFFSPEMNKTVIGEKNTL